MADMAQNGTDRCGTGVDMRINAQGAHHGHHCWVIDQSNRHFTAHGFGTHSRQHIGFVVIRNRQNRISASNSRLGQQGTVQPITVQHDCAFQCVCGLFRDRTIALNHLDAHTAIILFKGLGHTLSHVSAPDDDNAFLLCGGFAENFSGTQAILMMTHHVTFVTWKQLIARLRSKQNPLAAHTHHNRAQR